MIGWLWMVMACTGPEAAQPADTGADTATVDSATSPVGLATGDTAAPSSTHTLRVDDAAWSEAPVATDFFYVPKTQEAHDAYLDEARPGRRVRLTVVESAMNHDPAVTDLATAIASAEAYIDAAAEGLHELDDHDTLLLPIVKMPPWLSSSSDCATHSAEDGWLVCQTVGPRDPAQWEALVESIVRRLTVVAPEASLAFEVWNEPDLYWTASEADLLALYSHTVAAVHRVDPSLPVGGFGTNQPDGRVPGADGPLVDALAAHVVQEGLPLDFLSVHVFADHPGFVHRGMDEVDHALDAHGLTPPVWVTEFNDTSAYRGAAMHPAGFASLLGAMDDRGVQARYLATWHDFDEVTHDGGYGLYRYDMTPKPVVAVHDALRGVDAHPETLWQTTEGGTLGMAVGRGEGTDAVVWNLAADPVVAAVEALLAEVEPEEVVAAYGADEQQLVADLQRGTTHEPSLETAFAAAGAAWADAEARQSVDTVVVVELGTGGELEVERLDASGAVPWH